MCAKLQFQSIVWFFTEALLTGYFLLALQRETIPKYNLENPHFFKVPRKQIRIVLQDQIHKPK